MPVLTDWDLALDADMVLWGQGANAAVIRSRRPSLAILAERALVEGRPLLSPVVLYDRFAIAELQEERVIVGPSRLGTGRGYTNLAGPMVAQHLAAASEVWIAVCTVGGNLVRFAEELAMQDATRALALDGLASAAVEALSEAFCRYVAEVAASVGYFAGIPLIPGVAGWPLQDGQRQVFDLLDTSTIGVHLAVSGLMSPIKSVSLVIGTGNATTQAGRRCDNCAMRPQCRYRDRD